jgi:hypothetical protein
MKHGMLLNLSTPILIERSGQTSILRLKTGGDALPFFTAPQRMIENDKATSFSQPRNLSQRNSLKQRIQFEL